MRKPIQKSGPSQPAPGEGLRIRRGSGAAIARQGSNVFIRFPCRDVYEAMQLYDTLSAAGRTGRVCFDLVEGSDTK